MIGAAIHQTARQQGSKMKNSKLHRTLAILAIALACTAAPATAQEVTASRSDLIRRLLPTVVNIAVRKEVAPEVHTASASASAGKAGQVKAFVGSGFIIDPSGLIVTNYHVVEDAFEITVTLNDGTILAGKLLHASRLADLAVLQVQAGHPLIPVKWGDSNKLRVGDQVFAIGNPLGLGTSVSGGIVSGLNRDAQESPYDDFIQTDAAINHGNSGGPLFDMEGEVVGVDSAMISPTESFSGLGLAIPSDDAQFVVDRLIKYGWIRPGWVGIKVQQVTREIAEAMGASQPAGSLVSWVIPDSAGAKAGLAIGDVIIKYGDDTPSDDRALLRDIGQTDVGKTVQVVVLREGVQHSLPVTIEAWPRAKWEERDAPTAALAPKATIPPDLGLALAAIDKSQRAKLDFEYAVSGVLISSVQPNSDAARRGAVAGDIILRVQDKTVADPADVLRAIAAARSERRPFVMMLVLPKVRTVPGPRWVTLRLNEDAG
jgi:serine protease Do